MLSCVLYTYMSRFGRRRPYYVAMALMISSAVFVSLSPNFIVYCILQFIVAVNTVACFATGVTIGDKQHSLSQQPLLSSSIPPFSNYFHYFHHSFHPLGLLGLSFKRLAL